MWKRSLITAYIAVGSNLGNRNANVRTAMEKLAQTKGIEVVRASRLMENPAIGMSDDAPPFFNGAIEIQTSLDPQAVLHRLLEIEREMGRQRRDRWEPRIIDLDLLLYGNQILSSEELIVPHLRMHERRFVLQPLAEIAPDVVHPTLRVTIASLLENLPLPQTSGTTA